MRIKLFNEFKENEKNTPTIYKDDNLEIKVSKTLYSAKSQNINTSWCSSSPQGFYNHNKTANMYRFNFKDGYKLRLTWDYIDSNASELGNYSGGTHWGQGGIINGEKQWYTYIKPEDESEPFLFDYNKNDSRQLMVDRIQSIPQKAIDAVHEYQDKHSYEKTANLNYIYNEINKIKLIDCREGLDKWGDPGYIIVVEYKGNKSEIIFTMEYGYIRLNTKELDKFISKSITNSREYVNYLKGKAMELLKKKGISLKKSEKEYDSEKN